MALIATILGGILIGMGALALFTRPSESYIASEGIRAWYTYSILSIVTGALAAILRSWWPLLAWVFLMWLIHNVFGRALARSRITPIAKEHIKALGYGYSSLRAAFPSSTTQELLGFLVAGVPGLGIEGRYDEPEEVGVRRSLLAGIESGAISSPIEFVLASLAVEGKIRPRSLSPSMRQRWDRAILDIFEGFGVSRAETVGDGDT